MDRGAWRAAVHGVLKEWDMTELLNNNNETKKSLKNLNREMALSDLHFI